MQQLIHNVKNQLSLLVPILIVMLSIIATSYSHHADAQSAPLTNAPTAESGPSEILSFENESQRKVYDDLILELRCPKCQNQNIADSNADIAIDLRNKVYEMALDNKGKREIKQFMLARYGEFVLYKPQFSGKTLLLWLGPIFILLCVVFFVARLIIRNAAHLDTEETTD